MSISDPQRALDTPYDAQALERAAQAHWNARDAYRVIENASKKKFYAC